MHRLFSKPGLQNGTNHRALFYFMVVVLSLTGGATFGFGEYLERQPAEAWATPTVSQSSAKSEGLSADQKTALVLSALLTVSLYALFLHFGLGWFEPCKNCHSRLTYPTIEDISDASLGSKRTHRSERQSCLRCGHDEVLCGLAEG